jgi:hypothetical protein
VAITPPDERLKKRINKDGQDKELRNAECGFRIEEAFNRFPFRIPHSPIRNLFHLYLSSRPLLLASESVIVDLSKAAGFAPSRLQLFAEA